jgi:hypothetical protein
MPRNKKNEINLKTADFMFRYNPTTGTLKWRHSMGSARAGSLAGSIDSYGNRFVRTLGETYSAARLCWFLHYRSWPTSRVYFIDGDGTNMKIDNLILEGRNLSATRNATDQRRYRALIAEAFRRIEVSRMAGTPLYTEWGDAESETDADDPLGQHVTKIYGRHVCRAEKLFLHRLRQQIAAEWQRDGHKPY